MNRVMLRGIQCYGCRSHVIQSFLAIADITFPAPLYHKPYTPSLQHQSSFSSLRAQSPRGQSAAPSTTSKEPSEEASSEQPPEAPSQSNEHVPWYLKEEAAAEGHAHPLGPRQSIPPLPDNPPPILEELLQHISVDIGLDDLSLLDLRHRNPPPALGANLIMVVGTARSVKHLNVAADRLCRWLRSTHKLSPTADGLLGRNELKIKLRRKARRAKMTNSSGFMSEEKDDGITTGWICVNVGSVENGKPPADAPKRDFAGFGNVSDSARIVVQMLTEEKRAELDLEGLWSGKSSPRPAVQLNAFEHQFVASYAPKGSMDAAGAKITGFPTPRGVQGTSSEVDRGQGQRRGFHTTRKVQNVTLEAAVIGCPIVPRLGPQSQSSAHIGTLSSAAPQSLKKPQNLSPEIASLLQKLSQLSPEEALRQLGTGPQDQNSTLFLRLFYETLSKPECNPDDQVLAKLELVRLAVLLKHPNYSKSDLFDAFKDLASSGCEITEKQALQTVKTLLSFADGDTDIASAAKRVSRPDIELALEVLNHMSLRGMDILSRDIFAMLYNASGFQGAVRPANGQLGPGSVEAETSTPVAPTEFKEVKVVQERLRKIMDAFDVKFGPEQFHSLLRFHFQHQNYDQFWAIWSKISLLQLPRTKEAYVLLFHLHAERGNQKRAAECISSWAPMMAREQPPVPLDAEVARAIMACLLVADPGVKQRVDKGETGEFPNLWSRCWDVMVASKKAAAASQ